MGYYLDALIARHEVLLEHAAAYSNAHVVRLAQGLSMIPIIGSLADELGGDSRESFFYKFSSDVEAWAREMSYTAPVACVEAEYFGGRGSQGAVVWEHGARLLGPLCEQGAINQALRLLGVQVTDDHVDEFAAVGLPRHRETEEWI